MTENISTQYRIMSNQNENDNARIMLLRHDEYEGIVYKYGVVSIDEKGNQAYLNFEYFIEENPDNVDTDSNEFRNFIGDVLTDIISTNEEMSEEDGNGPDHTIESSDE